MIKYIMTSSTLDGEVEFTFTHDGKLRSIVFQCEATEKQYNYIFAAKPHNLEQMKHLIDTTRYATFVKEVQELTFQMFWDKYNEKEHSSKKKAEIRWNNMPKSARIKAFNYIAKYKFNLPADVRLKYAETYLNSEIWEK